MFSVKILHLFLLASLGLGATPETPKMRLICEKELEGFVLIHLNDSETRTAYEIRARYYRTLQHHIHLKRLRLNDEKNRAIKNYLDTLIPLTGTMIRVSWKELDLSHGTGVFDALGQEVQWKIGDGTNMSGAYDPIRERIEWRRSGTHYAASVFNPLEGDVKSETSFSAVGGVFDPYRSRIVWKYGRNAEQNMAAVYNPIEKRIETRSSNKPIVGFVEVFKP